MWSPVEVVLTINTKCFDRTTVVGFEANTLAVIVGFAEEIGAGGNTSCGVVEDVVPFVGGPM